MLWIINLNADANIQYSYPFVSMQVKDWGPENRPFEVHREYSPNCEYISNNGGDSGDNHPLASRGAAGELTEVLLIGFFFALKKSVTHICPGTFHTNGY